MQLLFEDRGKAQMGSKGKKKYQSFRRKFDITGVGGGKKVLLFLNGRTFVCHVQAKKVNGQERIH
jgi:hypothetical protein